MPLVTPWVTAKARPPGCSASHHSDDWGTPTRLRPDSMCLPRPRPRRPDPVQGGRLLSASLPEPESWKSTGKGRRSPASKEGRLPAARFSWGEGVSLAPPRTLFPGKGSSQFLHFPATGSETPRPVASTHLGPLPARACPGAAGLPEHGGHACTRHTQPFALHQEPRATTGPG